MSGQYVGEDAALGKRLCQEFLECCAEQESPDVFQEADPGVILGTALISNCRELYPIQAGNGSLMWNGSCWRSSGNACFPEAIIGQIYFWGKYV